MLCNPSRPRAPILPLHSREPDGWHNDLAKPEMGSASLNLANPADTSDFTLSSVAAVPDSATPALVLLGLLMTGLVVRRSRANA